MPACSYKASLLGFLLRAPLRLLYLIVLCVSTHSCFNDLGVCANKWTSSPSVHVFIDQGCSLKGGAFLSCILQSAVCLTAY